jgi:hypothetical protein
MRRIAQSPENQAFDEFRIRIKRRMAKEIPV